MIERIKNNKFPILVVIIILLVFWTFFIPGTKAALDFPIISSDFLKAGLNLPQAWQTRSAEGMGEYAVPTLWSWPTDFFYGLGATFGLTFDIIERISGFVGIYLIGIFSINIFLKHLGIKRWGRLVGILFYLLTTYLILLIDGGQFLVGLAYAWFPLSYIAVEKAVSKQKLKNFILTGVAVSVLGFFDVRFVYILALLIALRFVYEFLFLERKEWVYWIWSWLKVGFVIVLIMVGLNAYWVLPSLLSKSPALPHGTNIFSSSFTTLSHALFLLQPHWYKNIFGRLTNLRPEFVFLPTLVFIAPVIKRRSKVVGFWFLVAILSVFLTKGASPPFPDVYPWLFKNVPGFLIFRDSTKFFFLVCLSYSYLIAVTIDSLSIKLKLIVPIVIIYFVLLIYPVYTLQMTSVLSKGGLTSGYEKMSQFLSNDKSFGRVLWVPSRAVMGYADTNHPVVEALRLIERRPFASGVIGSYELSNFLRDSHFIGQILNISGIGYVSYPYPDKKREELTDEQKKYYFNFYNQVTNKDWVSKVMNFGSDKEPLPLYFVKQHEDRFFVIPNTWLVVGGERIYEEMDKNRVDLTKNGLVFLDERSGLGKLVDEIPYSKILLYKRTQLDLIASLIPKTNLVFPADKLEFSPDASGWWKRGSQGIISWRTFLQEKYSLDNLDFDLGEGFAIGEGEKSFTISSRNFVSGKKFLVRVMKSSRGGKISFYQGESLIGTVATSDSNNGQVSLHIEGSDKTLNYEDSQFLWVEVGRLEKNGDITIKSSGDINVVNVAAVVSEEDLNSLKEKVSSLISQKRVLMWDQEDLGSFSGVSSATVSYEKIAPTFYKVKIKKVTKPFTIAFSDTYDSLWEMGSQSSFPLYSLINGFRVEKDGEFDVYYSPQKYVELGLFLSVLSSFVIFLLFLKFRKN